MSKVAEDAAGYEGARYATVQELDARASLVRTPMPCALGANSCGNPAFKPDSRHAFLQVEVMEGDVGQH
jgi:hypothetical protein